MYRVLARKDIAEGKRDLTLLFGVRLLSAMGVTLILPVMPAMARTFGLSIAEAGMVVVCFTLAEATMTPVAGVLSDRFGRMAVLLPALLVFAGGGASLRRAGEMC